MTRLLCAALALLVAALALADDWKWDAKKERKPEKGYRSVSESESVEKTSRASRMGRLRSREASEAKTVTRYEQEILEVADGKVSKSRVKIEKWSRTADGGEADRCLEGQAIVVEGRGAAIKWRCEDATRELTEAAKDWIAQTLAAKDEDANEEAFRSCLPAKPIEPGTEWTADPAPIAKVFLGPELALDAAKSSAKGKLGEVKTEDGVHVGTYTLEVVIVSKAEKEEDAVRMKFSAVFEGSLEPDRRDASSMTLTLEAKARQTEQTEEGLATLEIENSVTAKESERPAAVAAPKK